MTIIERVEAVKRLWSLLIPVCEAPEDCQIARWVSRFNDYEIEYAVTRTAHKLRNGLTPDPVTAGRYCTGVLTNERQSRTKEGVR